MKSNQRRFGGAALLGLLLLSVPAVLAQDCSDCHAAIYSKWANGAHADTQTNLAAELALSNAGLTPDAVIQGIAWPATARWPSWPMAG